MVKLVAYWARLGLNQRLLPCEGGNHIYQANVKELYDISIYIRIILYVIDLVNRYFLIFSEQLCKAY